MQENSFEHTQEQALKPPSLGWRSALKLTREVYIWIIGVNIFLGLFKIVFGGPDSLLLLLSVVLPIAGIIMGVKRALPQAQSGFPIFRTALLIGAIPLAILFLIEAYFILSSIDALRANGLFGSIVVVGQISQYAFSLFFSSLVYSITASIILFKREVTGNVSLGSFFRHFTGLVLLLILLYVTINGISAAALLVLSNTTASESQEDISKETSISESFKGNIYKSSNASFSIQTPPNFEQIEFVSSLGMFREYTENEEDGVIQDEEGRWVRAGINIHIVSVGGEYAERLERGNKDFLNAASGDLIESEYGTSKKVKNIDLDGCSAVWISSVSASVREDSTVCLHNNKDSIVITLVTKEEVFSEYIEDYEEMLATFSFEKTEDETVNWQTYRNEEFGFELEYPSNFAIGVCTQRSISKELVSIGFDDRELISQEVVGCDIGQRSYGIVLEFEGGSYATLEEIVNSIPLGSNHYLGLTESITFNNSNFIKLQRFDSRGLDLTLYFISYPQSVRFLKILISPHDSTNPQTGKILEYDKIGEQILSTFRFIE